MLSSLIAVVSSAVITMGVAIAPAHASEPPDLSGIGGLIDGYVARSMAEEKVPGAAVTVVAGGRQVYSKGYGLADVERGIPVDPERTRFLVGSETKLFTAQAALQMVQAGKLNLDADVNTYLTTFKIKNTYPGWPVTLRNLLTHTAGFDEDYLVGSGGEDPKDVEPLGRALADTQPARVRPPGTVTYSNYGIALAGYLVETVSGLPYADYVQRNVFAPLDMENSAIACGGQAVAEAYTSDGAPTKVTCANYSASGAGPVSTAADMGRYMIAQLSGDPRLGPGIAEQMQRQQHTEDPRLSGMGYVFEEMPYKGHRLLFKGGDMPGMHAFMVLLPDQDIGLQVLSNGDGKGRDGVDGIGLAEQIVDHYLPALSPPAAKPLAGATSEQYEGWYLSSRTSHGSIFKLRSLLGTPVHVTPAGDGRLRTTGIEGKPTYWTQIEPGVFQQSGGWSRIAFPQPGVLAISGSTVVFDRIGLLDHPWVHLGLAAFGIVVLAATLIGMPAVAVVRRARRRPAHPRAARIARLLAWLTSVTVIVSIVGLGTLMADQSRALPIVLEGSPSLITMLGLASLSVPLAACVVFCAAAAWWKRWWRLPGRLSYMVSALAATSFATVATIYNLVGPPYT
ncbi:serine hydrolase domain-containing protein [Nonomuraea sp. NPDC005983]|uniref:serine hydrolase domain-containing protein n=1 Tax=Nonomuraea sp. NPDC005983 TaxID=3155595 RepID=UPI0033BB435E